MHPGAGWIHRDELREWVRHRVGRVSVHQLLNWHDKGLLPQPRRVGRGRGRGGSDSYYPWWAAIQAAALAWHLAEQRRRSQRRNLRDAGWALWIEGFPVTPFARRLLLEELDSSDLRHEYQRYRAGRSSTVFEIVAERPPAPLKAMAQAVPAPAFSTVLRIIAELQLGLLDPQAYTEEQWQDVQDVVVAGLLPSLEGDSELPSPKEVASGLARLSRTQNLPRVIKALKRIDDRHLCMVRNEAQALFARVAQAVGHENALITRDRFLTYFKARVVDPDATKDIVQMLRALQLSPPPRSRFAELILQLLALQAQQPRDRKVGRKS